MRVSDLMLNNSFISNLNSTKANVSKLQMDIATQKKIRNPSDSPYGTSKILKLNEQLSLQDSYAKNVENGLAFLNETSFEMDSIQSDVQNVQTALTELQNPTNQVNLQSYADQIDQALNSILNHANAKFNGKYVFGGTDFSSEPYGYDSSNTSIETKVGDTSGTQVVKTSQNIFQKINLTGSEVFGTIVKNTGTFDASAAAGTVTNSQTQVYDAQGNQYNLNVTYTKTADNTYQMDYNIVDGGGTSVFSTPPSSQTFKFNVDSGQMETLNGSSPAPIKITLDSPKIDFKLDVTSLRETSGSTSLSFSANQKMDIFNTLISIRDNLKNGKLPTDAQVSALDDFNKHLLDKTSQIGNSINQLNATSNVLNSQKLTLQGLLSQEQDVDIAQATVDLQAQDYSLQMSYKIASMILPKSLLDFL